MLAGILFNVYQMYFPLKQDFAFHYILAIVASHHVINLARNQHNEQPIQTPNQCPSTTNQCPFAGELVFYHVYNDLPRL